jgi:hypothetical protein
VILGSGLEVVLVLEAGGVSVSEEEGHEGVTIIDTVDLVALEELEDVVLNDGVLGGSGTLGTGGLETDGITESENVVVLLVLESVLVNIEKTLAVCEVGILDPLVGLGGRVDVGLVEVLLNNLTRVDILESSDLLSVVKLLDLHHFPAEHHFDTTLVALVKSDLVGVAELVDLLVGSPVLNACIGSSTAVKSIESLEVLVVGSVEIGTYTLIRELGGVANGVTIEVLPAGVVVLTDSFLVIEDVSEDVVCFITIGELSKTFNRFHGVVEAGGKNKGLVVESLTVGHLQRVGVTVDLGDFNASLNLGPLLNLGRDGVGHQSLILNVLVDAGEVDLGADVDGILTDDGHLEAHLLGKRVLLDVGEESS